jgi:prepilin-type N-terminal cleavage/methylation domain-containing protein
MNLYYRKQLGFTLVEMAIVLVIIGLLVSAFLAPLRAQRELRDYSETKQKIVTIKEGLLGFAVSNKRLPCPDTDGDGLENLAAPLVLDNTPAPGQSTQTFTCINLEGLLPFQTLGVDKIDSWSNLFSYRVAPAFSTRTLEWSSNGASGNVLSDTYFILSSVGNITIRTRGDNPATAGITESKFVSNLVTNAAAIIISHGKNGYGAITNSGAILPLPPVLNIDETSNTNIGTNKISRFAISTSNACSDIVEGSSYCEFDDQIDWLPSNLIFNRMVATGQLP